MAHWRSTGIVNLVVLQMPEPLAISSSSTIEETGHEGSLRLHVVAADVSNLPLPDHRHRLKTSQCPLCGWQAAKAEPRPDQPFDPPVILLNDVVLGICAAATARSATAYRSVSSRSPQPGRPGSCRRSSCAGSRYGPVPGPCGKIVWRLGRPAERRAESRSSDRGWPRRDTGKSRRL
jgi:hypothetical protein